MKTGTKEILVTLDKNELSQLTEEVNEVVATNVNVITQKTKRPFTLVDLWNVYNKKKKRQIREMFIP